MAIEFYKEFGSLGYLATYSDHGFYKDGVYYKSVEHYYQSEKFDDEDVKQRIIDANTPKEASIIGRDRSLRRKNNFFDIKLGVMYEGVLYKFRQNSDIRTKLIETRNEEIREMTVKESFWGVGPEFDGENHMGKILSVVREKVKEELLLKILSKCKNKKVYVIGHCNPDCDSIFSSLILTHILKFFGIDAVFGVRNENFLENELIHDFLEEDYEVVKEYKDKYFILVDHNDLSHMKAEQVLGAFDHHTITGEIEDLVEIEYASCGLLIYDLFKKIYKFSENEIKMIKLTVLSDTEYLTSSRFGIEDKKLYEELSGELDVEKLQLKYFKTTDFKESVEKNLKHNFKEYKRGNLFIKRSFISSYSVEKNKYYEKYVDVLEKNNIDLLIWCDYSLRKTYVHYKNMDTEFSYFTTSTNLILDYLEKELALI